MYDLQPLFFCRNRDLGTTSVYVGYLDVRFLPPICIYMLSLNVISANLHPPYRGGDNNPTENFVSESGAVLPSRLTTARDACGARLHPCRAPVYSPKSAKTRGGRYTTVCASLGVLGSLQTLQPYSWGPGSGIGLAKYGRRTP